MSRHPVPFEASSTAIEKCQNLFRRLRCSQSFYIYQSSDKEQYRAHVRKYPALTIVIVQERQIYYLVRTGPIRFGVTKETLTDSIMAQNDDNTMIDDTSSNNLLPWNFSDPLLERLSVEWLNSNGYVNLTPLSKATDVDNDFAADVTLRRTARHALHLGEEEPLPIHPISEKSAGETWLTKIINVCIQLCCWLLVCSTSQPCFLSSKVCYALHTGRKSTIHLQDMSMAS